MIFSQKTRTEFQLPTLSEEVYVFKLEKQVWDLTDTISIRMDARNGQWVFARAENYSLMRRDGSAFERPLASMERIMFKEAGSGVKLLLVPMESAAQIPVFRKYLLDPGKSPVTIGADPSCSICIQGNPVISGLHASLVYLENYGWALKNNGTNGSYLSKKYVTSGSGLEYGDQINLFGCRMIYLQDVLAVDESSLPGVTISVQLPRADQRQLAVIARQNLPSDREETEALFKSAPRVMADYDRTEINIDPPPTPQEGNQTSLLNTIGPSITMVIPMAAGMALMGVSGGLSIIMVVGSALVMTFWTTKNYFAQKKQIKAFERLRRDKYVAYLGKKEREIAAAYNEASQIITGNYPETKECLKYDRNTPALWNRKKEQADYLFVRLGIGSLPFEKPVRIPQEHFTLVDDDLAERPAKIRNMFAELKEVPVGFNLDDGPVFGIVGGEDKTGVYPLLRTLLVQLAANYSYIDMKIVFLCNGENSEDRRLLEQVKWLPHIWSDDRKVRYAGDSEDSIREVLNEIAPVLKSRWETQKGGSGLNEEVQGARYVIIATDRRYIENNMVSIYLSDVQVPVGATTFICAEHFNELPGFCTHVIENDESFNGIYAMHNLIHNSIRFDTAAPEKFAEFVHNLSSIRIQAPQQQEGIPKAITFFDMYHVKTPDDLQILDRWNKNRAYVSMSVPVGMASGEMYCNLDIHEKAHGPHGLVAGTTGSGKSETLMTFILSLAVNFSPEDISFLLVDFKGGGLTGPFDNPEHPLPHLAGTITNLGGNQIQRALVSITSENVRRQKLLASVGASDIYEYGKMYKNQEVLIPLPHLLIIVDEFAELKKQYPDFMAELISVAAIGRSLGVHLILATQKPAGVVDEKINSNTRFRVCLKVASQQDSKDMLKRPDAAFIPGNGRGFLRVGEDEIFQMFQSGWSGAEYAADDSVEQDDIAALYMITGRVMVTGTHQKMLRREKKASEWATQLIRAVRDVLGDTPEQLSLYLMNNESMTGLTERFYRYFAEHGINIAHSPANNEKILNLLTVYDLCAKQEEGQDVTPEQLRQTAQNTGRLLPEPAAKKQIDAVVEKLWDLAVEHKLVLEKQLWLPELPTELYLKDLEQYNTEKQGVWSLQAAIGRMDDPAHQYQTTVFMDFANVGNYAVIGSVLTGKSTLLQTTLCSMLKTYTADQLNVYCLDFSGRNLEIFREAPQVGGVLTEQSIDSISNFFFMIGQILKERKSRIRGVSFGQYQMQKDPSADTMPAILIVIDQYGAFREKTENVYDQVILQLAVEGQAYGIYLLFTAAGITTAEIPSKLGDAFKGRLVLQLNDTYEYRNILGVQKTGTLPEEGLRGRGLLNWHGEALEFQTAIVASAGDDFGRSRKVQEFCRDLAADWKGKAAKPIPMIPKEPKITDYLRLPEVPELLADDRSLPVGYDQSSAYPYSLDFSKFLHYLVSGRKKAGRANFMNLLLKMLAEKGGRIVVFGNGVGALKKLSDEIGAEYINDSEDLLPFCLSFKDEVSRRNARKHELEISGKSDEEIYEAMLDEERIYFLIEDLAEFTDHLYHPAEGCHDVKGFFETMAEKAWYHQMFFFHGVNHEETMSVRGTAFYKAVVRDGTGMHFGGNVAAQQLLTFDYVNGYKEQSKIEPPEVGMASTGEGQMKAGRVIIPDALK